ncbi:DUF2945 domain-containing protein [Rhizobium leguminosarum]|nr:DUF2945 domain-containing protein [Rhizobium leguminosarum]
MDHHLSKWGRSIAGAAEIERLTARGCRPLSRKHHASRLSPELEIKSSKTDHVALHRGQVLTLMGD